MRKRVRFQLGIDEIKPSTSLLGVDLEIMKGIAQSGVMEPGQPSLMGLYLPRKELVRCTNLPKTSSGYIQAKNFTLCGLYRIRLAETSWHPIDYDISARRNAIFWKTRSTKPDDDVKEAIVAAKNGYDTTLFVLTPKGVWILVSKHSDFELEVEDELEVEVEVEEAKKKVRVQFVSFR